MVSRRTVWLSALCAVALTACGGSGGGDGQPVDTGSTAGGDGPGTGPGTPGGGEVVMRESFGGGVGFARPAGGAGGLRSTASPGDIPGFWIEFPAGGAVAWGGLDGEGAWKFGGCSTDPNEAPSALQPSGNGCATSLPAAVPRFPDLVVALGARAGAYEVSLDVSTPALLAGAYVALGLSSSTTVATSNLATAGQVALLVRAGGTPLGTQMQYELRSGGPSGTLLASGPFPLFGYTPVTLRHDPVAGTLSATVNGAVVGPFPAAGVSASAVVIEGQGIVDNFAVRALP
jgi:hypothetical protein